MTSGEDASERLQYGEVIEEQGGPFVVTTAGQEFASGNDASNPRGSKREPFPRTLAIAQDRRGAPALPRRPRQ